MNSKYLEKNSLLGQVWTPDDVANEMAVKCHSLGFPIATVLDPACGPGTFSRALNKAGFSDITLTCYDVDPRMARLTNNVNRELNINSKVVEDDYLTDKSLKGKFDLIIMNPPYIRQENIPQEKKKNYHSYLSECFDVSFDKKANLFSLFLLKGIVDLTDGGVLCAIVYDAISQTRYGKQILDIINRHSVLLSHTKIKMPFDDVLVDASMLFFEKKKNYCTESSIQQVSANGDIPLGELLQTRRGTGFPLRKIFLAEKNDPYFDQAKPFFIKQATLDSLIIKPDNYAYILNEHDSISPQLHLWMKEKAASLNSSVERFSIKASYGKIAFNYYIRNKARHLWNKNDVAVSDNFYISSTKNDFPQEVAWLLLNSDMYLNRLLSSARSQGNGLLKLQLFEYKNTQVPNWNNLTDDKISKLLKVAISLIENEADYDFVRLMANKTSKGIFNV